MMSRWKIIESEKVNCLLTFIYRLCWYLCFYLICFWRDNPQWARSFSFTRFLYHTQRHTTVGRTPLDE